MRVFIIFLILSQIAEAQNNAPVDYTAKSIQLDPSKHVYFKLLTNTITSLDQSGWDIALYNDPHEIGGKINETKGVKAWRVFRDTTLFSGVTLADTLVSVSNNDSFAYLGALDTIYTGNLQTFFRIGIGKFYLDAGYSAVANRIYIIRKEDGSFGKFYVNYANRVFTVRYANIDNSGDKYIPIVKSTSPFTNHYQFIDLTSGQISSSQEIGAFDFDLVFRSYQKGNIRFPMGILTNNAYNLIRYSGVEGLPQDYLKYGVVSTECYEAIGDPTSVSYNNSLNTMEPISRLYNQIGEKWYNSTAQLPVQNKSYFLRDREGYLWHLIFTNYNVNTNTVDFAYKNKGRTMSIQSESMASNFAISQSGDMLVVERTNQMSKKSELIFMDISGKIIYKTDILDRKEFNVSQYKNSFLFIQSVSSEGTSNYKILVR